MSGQSLAMHVHFANEHEHCSTNGGMVFSCGHSSSFPASLVVM